MLFDSTARLWKNPRSPNYLTALNDGATSLMYNSEYHKALVIFFECLQLSKAAHNKSVTGKVLNNLGLVYESIGDYDNAIVYEKMSLPYKKGNSLAMARAIGNIGNAFMKKAMPDSGIVYEKRSFNLYSLVPDQQGMAVALGDIGNMYKDKHMNDSCLFYLLKAVVISQKLAHAENTANIDDDIATIYLERHDLVNSAKYVSLAAKYAPQITDIEFMQEHYSTMYEYFKQKGDIPQSFHYLEKLNAVNDSIFKQKINIQNQKIGFEYEYKQKKLTDSLNFRAQVAESEKQATASRNRMIVSLLMLLVAVLLAVIWYNRVKLLRKQNIVAMQNVAMQEQKIRELENEKQILASQAMLKGQEDERSRLARDLHDGLGGLLAGVKHSIINMKENVVITSDAAAVFERSLGMIDTAMKELRRVAQNMMPEALAKFGLEEALKDYCASSSTAACKVIFQSFGGPAQLDSATEIIIYRIIQELVYNALKHAEASQIMVQLVKGDDWITLSVEDNGKGFDVNKLKTAAGAGWSNISSRLDYLKGKIDLKSQQDMGTSVNIEIKIPEA